MGLQCHSCHLCSITQPICSSQVVLTPLYTICWMERFQRSFCTRELISRKSAWRRPHLHFKYICRKDMRATDMDIKRWEDVTNDHSHWRHDLHQWLRQMEVYRWREACFDGKKTTQRHQGRASSPAFFVVKNATPMWACTVITDAVPPSAVEA